MHSDRLKNQFWLKKSYVTDFFVEQFFFYKFVNDFWELLICKINILRTFWMVDFLKILSHQEVYKVLSETHFSLGM